MTTATATAANLSVLFANFCRSQGLDPASVEGFKFQSPEYAVSIATEPVAVTVPKRSADEVFGPEEVIKPKKVKAQQIKKPSMYREYQATCKAYGLKANGSTSVLKDRIDAHINGTATSDMYTKVKATRAPKAAKVKENFCGLTYRQTQRLVSWFKANMPSNLLPAQLTKNIGWGNVKSNAAACMTANGWAAKLNDKQVQMMCDYVGIIDGDQLVTFLDESGLA